MHRQAAWAAAPTKASIISAPPIPAALRRPVSLTAVAPRRLVAARAAPAPGQRSGAQEEAGRESSDRDEEEFNTVAGAVEVVDEDEAEVRRRERAPSCGGRVSKCFAGDPACIQRMCFACPCQCKLPLVR